MISADEARALLNRQSYKAKIKEYEEKIEKAIVQAAKNNQSMVMTVLEDEDPLFTKALSQVLTNLVNNGFEVSRAVVDHNKYVVFISW